MSVSRFFMILKWKSRQIRRLCHGCEEAGCCTRRPGNLMGYHKGEILESCPSRATTVFQYDMGSLVRHRLKNRSDAKMQKKVQVRCRASGVGLGPVSWSLWFCLVFSSWPDFSSRVSYFRTYEKLVPIPNVDRRDPHTFWPRSFLLPWYLLV